MEVRIVVVGEDQLCCALAIKLVRHLKKEAIIQQSTVANGCAPFRLMIDKMNSIAQTVMPVLMLADADQAPCVVTQRDAWMPAHPSPRLSLRLAVREAESWVLADHEGFSAFAQLSPALMTRSPDKLMDPKQELLRLIRKSKRRDLREEMLPRKGSSSPVGLGYNNHLTQFVHEFWCAERASERSPSLARSIPRIAAIL
ncbi:hypothetical protein J2Y39_004278 [Pseudomonas sp. 2957]|nr:hypothetical protein [Pseudomonas sp. 2957]